VNLDFDNWQSYVCNETDGRGVCNEGYAGNRICQKETFKKFTGKKVTLEIILDLDPNNPTLDVKKNFFVI
jgi:hypothetical protein